MRNEVMFRQTFLSDFVGSQNFSVFVIPANAGIQGNHPAAVGLDSRVRGSDGLGDHQHNKFENFP